MVNILKQCQKEILGFPIDVREDLADLITKLGLGLKISMPLSKPIPTLGKGVQEFRLKNASGIFRVIYIFKDGDFYLIHGFKKKSQKTSKLNLTVARKRLKEI